MKFFGPCLLIVILSTMHSVFGAPPETGESGSVYYASSSDKYYFTPGRYDTHAAAWGRWDDTMDSVGWAKLWIHSHPAQPNSVQAYAAGLLEGSLTRHRCWQSFRNWKGNTFPHHANTSSYPPRIAAFVATHLAWVERMAAAHENTDPLWHQVALLLAQLRGLAAGSGITFRDLFWMHLIGDLGDLLHRYHGEDGAPEALDFDHCSAMVKWLPDHSDLIVAHTTWNAYYLMLNVLKTYDLPYTTVPRLGAPRVPGATASFSAYPALIFSYQDFFALSSGLAVVETTFDIFNRSLDVHMRPESLMVWARMMIANRLAADGEQWCRVFRRYNSGTYNNMFLVVDYNRYAPGQTALAPGTVWKLEQIPGQVRMEDVTAELARETYIPSYNIPSFPDLFAISGNPAMVARYGEWFDFHKNPRAQIFRRDQGHVTTPAAMRAFMLYNDWQHDPLSHRNAANAIASRKDLIPAQPVDPNPFIRRKPAGALDCKIVDAHGMAQQRFDAYSGPTALQQRPFRWSDTEWEHSVLHEGHPEVFDFDWITFAWSGAQE
eukprot:gnl/Trimastix_PCT/1894.p1 GENE.gnl/Trimastix_PCT/1894~~gnl/Trimastix_PCT/1894.p1  ORF type:complete len:547 (+),score=130.39 gnl/Trimastix_PCT/1894:813-2453(+)